MQITRSWHQQVINSNDTVERELQISGSRNVGTVI
jgi:hypothetical protein